MTSLLVMSVLLGTLPATQEPASRLSDARLVPATDTMDTWDRRSDQPRRKDPASYIQALSHLPSGDWQIRREWRDSLGTVTSVGTTVLVWRRSPHVTARHVERHRIGCAAGRTATDSLRRDHPHQRHADLGGNRDGPDHRAPRRGHGRSHRLVACAARRRAASRPLAPSNLERAGSRRGER